MWKGSNFLSLNNFGLVIFDEVHRSVGDYAYVKISEKYQQIPESQILGLTASPGSKLDKIKEVIVKSKKRLLIL